MPEPISTITATALVAGSALLSGLGQRHTASPSGDFVRQQAKHFQNYSQHLPSQNSQRSSLILELKELYQEHQELGWDGESAPPLAEVTMLRFLELLSTLPSDLPDPELAVEPDDGALSLEWRGGYRQVASISLNPSERISFASLQGTDISYGAYRITRKGLPQAVLATIREILQS